MRGLRWCLSGIKPTNTDPRVRPDSPCTTSKSFLEQSAEDAAAGETHSWDDMPQHVLEVIFIQVWESTHPSVRHKVGLRLCRVCCRWRHMVQQMFFVSPWAAAPAMVHPMQLSTLCPPGLGPSGLLRGYVVRQPAALGLPGRRLLLTFHAGADPSSGKFLLAARPGGSGSGVAWSISADRRGQGRPLAVLRTNLLATSYSLALGSGLGQGGGGARPGRGGPTPPPTCPASPSTIQDRPLAVQYQLGMRGMTLPRRVAVLLEHVPGPSPVAATSGSSSSSSWAQTSRHSGAAAAGVAGSVPVSSHGCYMAAALGPSPPPAWGTRPGPLLLENRRPHWNEGLRCWCLNFKGRVKLASIKNFQLQLVGPGRCQAAGISGSHQQPVPQARFVEVGDHLQQQDEVEEEEEEEEEDEEQQQQQQEEAAPAMQLQGPHPAAGSTPSRRARPAYQGPGGIPPGGLVLQFGKVEEHLYVLDYAPHLMTAVEAFATALTSFDSKMLM